MRARTASTTSSGESFRRLMATASSEAGIQQRSFGIRNLLRAYSAPRGSRTMNSRMVDTLTHPWTAPPEPGDAVVVAPGIKWLRMPLPFALNHINLWLLEDDG